MIVWATQIAFLHVAVDELRIGDSLVATLRLGGADEVGCAVDTDRAAARADTSRNEDGAVSEAASDIENTPADRELAPAQCSIAVLRQPIGLP